MMFIGNQLVIQSIIYIMVIKMNVKKYSFIIMLFVISLSLCGIASADTGVNLVTLNATHINYYFNDTGYHDWVAPYDGTVYLVIVSTGGSGGTGGLGSDGTWASTALGGGGGGGGGSGYYNTTSMSVTKGVTYDVDIIPNVNTSFSSYDVMSGDAGTDGTDTNNLNVCGSGGAGGVYRIAGADGADGSTSGVGGDGGLGAASGYTVDGVLYGYGGDGGYGGTGYVSHGVRDPPAAGEVSKGLVKISLAKTDTGAYIDGDEETYSQHYYSVLEDSITLDSDVQILESPLSGDFVVASTDDYVSKITIDGYGTGFGTIINSSPETAGTPYSLDMSNIGSYYMEGRSISTSIFKSDGTLSAGYDAGGYTTDVSISRSTGLWAISGATDEKYYVFSKEAGSDWYIHYSGEPYDLVEKVKMSLNGSYYAIGYDDGRTRFYKTVSETTNETTITTFSVTGSLYIDGVKGTGKTVEIYESYTTYPSYDWKLNT